MGWLEVAASLVLLAAPAEDDEWAEEGRLFLYDESHVSFEVGHHGEEAVESWSFLLSSRVVVAEGFALELAVPFAYAGVQGVLDTGQVIDDSALQFGNPSFAAFFGGVLGRGAAWEIGVGVAMPTAQADLDGGDLAPVFALAFAQGQRGLFDLYHFEPETIALFFPMRLELVGPSGIFFDGVLKGQSYYPLDGRGSIYALQTSFEVGYRAGVFEAGVALGAWIGTLESDLDAQVHLQPRVRAYFVDRARGAAPFGQLRVVVNLDDPLGFDRRGGAIVGYLFTLGVAWR